MIKQKYGRIINIASQLGQVGGVALIHYCAAKAGVIGFIKSLAREVGHEGITVNCMMSYLTNRRSELYACLTDE